MASQEMHGSGVRLVNTKDFIQLETEQSASGSGNVNCHIFKISDSLTCCTGNWNLCNTKYMNLDNIPFNALIVGPTNLGKTRFVVEHLRGPFHGKFNFIVLICPTFAHNKTLFSFGENDPRAYVLIWNSMRWNFG